MKPILIILHGKSCEQLEERINEFKDLDVAWGSISTFDIPQKYILDKINKKFDIVFDSSTVKNEVEYEQNVRMPRLSKYFNETNSKYICTKSDKNNLYQLRERLYPEFNHAYNDKIIYVEDLGINPNPFCVSLHLYIACLLKLGYTNIILFGADGGANYGNSIESYYKWEEVKKDKEIAGNLSYNMIGDSNNVNSTFIPLMSNIFGFVPKIINCSPNSLYICFEKIDYSSVIQYIRSLQ